MAETSAKVTNDLLPSENKSALFWKVAAIARDLPSTAGTIAQITAKKPPARKDGFFTLPAGSWVAPSDTFAIAYEKQRRKEKLIVLIQAVVISVICSAITAASVISILT